MPGNMNNLMKQAQKMQRQMEENQKALEEAEFKSTSGGGAVEVTVNGKKEVTKLKIDPEAVDPEDVEMLEDMIIAALNEAFRQVDDQKAKMMGQFGGGMGGLGSGLFYWIYLHACGAVIPFAGHRAENGAAPGILYYQPTG